ncbi:MAG TPA: stringent starvation protein A [Gammaproteobacteria bacterium]|nr:stringent starvation protein A [Gammaproteobacteria bacterium]
MAALASRRPIMTLYSGSDCPQSQRVRLVLAEKGITVDVVEVDSDSGQLPEDLLELNPYHCVPTLVDRDLVLYNAAIIMEYLDERYPHPPLMPIDPVSRARGKLYMHRIERDWYSLLDELCCADEQRRTPARRALCDGLTLIAPVFEQRPYFMGDELCLVDHTLAPLLWRLPAFGVELPAHARPLRRYARRIFERHAFRASLTESERGIHS